MKLYFLIILVGISFTSLSQLFSEVVKAVGFDRDEGDRFGYAVSLDNNVAVIGAYTDDITPPEPNTGAVYVYEKAGVSDWTFTQKLTPEDYDLYDRFGNSVAVHENFIVVGSYAEDHDENGDNELSRAGSAYIFEKGEDGVWNQVQKIVASDREENDQFGWDVAIHNETIIVGALTQSQDEVGDNYIHHAGAAYIFERDEAGEWLQSQKIVGSDRAPDITSPDGSMGDNSDHFGGSVHVYNNYLIVGAYQQDLNAEGGDPISQAGKAYVFEKIGPTWVETAILVNADRAEEDQFGYDVAISEEFAIVAAYSEDEDASDANTMNNAGSCYIFARNPDGEWIESQKIVASDRSVGDRFGWSVDIADSTIIVGAIECSTNEEDEESLTDAGAGYVFIYDEETSTWIENQKIDASDRHAFDLLGGTVTVYGDDILMGAYQHSYDLEGDNYESESGAAYFYSRTYCTPSSSSQTITLCAGQTVSVGPNTYSETGEYEDILLNESGCDSIITTNLTVLPAPTYSQTVELCYGYAYDIAGTSHSETGEYIDTVSTFSGCDSIVYTNLTIKPENAVTQEITICWGESFKIGASTYNEPGTYIDVLTSHDLCDSIITTILNVQLPVDNSLSQTLNVLTAGSESATYQWAKCDPFEIIEGATSREYWAPTTGKYAVIVTEEFCTDTSACLYVDQLDINHNTSSKITCYPNPNNGSFWIDGPQNELFKSYWQLINPLGEIIEKIEIKNLPYSLNFNNLAPGLYVLIGTTNSENIVIKQILIESF